MARTTKLMDQNVEPEWYAPDVDDNRDDEDPVGFLVTPMTARDRQKVQEAEVGTLKRRKINLHKISQRTRDRSLKNHVHKIRNYNVEDASGKIVAIEDVGTFLKLLKDGALGSAEEEYLDDTYNAIQDEALLEEGLEKKSPT